MLKLIKSLDVVTTNYADEPFQWAFVTEDAQRNYIICLGKRRAYISLLTEKEQQARKAERREHLYQRSPVGFKRSFGSYFLKVGRREFVFCPNERPKRRNWEKKGHRVWLATEHTRRFLNTELFLGRHSLIVSTTR